eukprot:gene7874-9692_t
MWIYIEYKIFNITIEPLNNNSQVYLNLTTPDQSSLLVNDVGIPIRDDTHTFIKLKGLHFYNIKNKGSIFRGNITRSNTIALEIDNCTIQSIGTPVFYGSIGIVHLENGSRIPYIAGSLEREMAKVRISNTRFIQNLNASVFVTILTSDVTIDNCTFQGNLPVDDLMVIYGKATIRNSNFRNNKGSTNLYNNGGILENCNFYNNQCDRGIVKISGNDTNTSFTIRNSTFEANRDNFGGALSLKVCNFLVDQCHFIKNTALSKGGSIFISDAKSCTIRNSIFENNECNQGGGAIFVQSVEKMTIERSTFNGNRDAVLYCAGSTVDIDNITQLTNNTSSYLVNLPIGQYCLNSCTFTGTLFSGKKNNSTTEFVKCLPFNNADYKNYIIDEEGEEVPNI